MFAGSTAFRAKKQDQVLTITELRHRRLISCDMRYGSYAAGAAAGGRAGIDTKNKDPLADRLDRRSAGKRPSAATVQHLLGSKSKAKSSPVKAADSSESGLQNVEIDSDDSLGPSAGGPVQKKSKPPRRALNGRRG